MMTWTTLPRLMTTASLCLAVCYSPTEAFVASSQKLSHGKQSATCCTSPTMTQLRVVSRSVDQDLPNENDGVAPLSGRRRECIQTLLTTAATLPLFLSTCAFAFEGGVGGLGKTKPNVGVTFLEGSVPMQNSKGVVSAELLTAKAGPIRVNFECPWPLLTTSSGLEARNLQQPESAFVQVIEGASAKNEKQLKINIVENVLGSQGKFGAYGTPTDIKIKTERELDLYSATFTALTPSMRESERQLYVRTVALDNNVLVLLVTGSTRIRFASQQETLKQVADSFVAAMAPPLRNN